MRGSVSMADMEVEPPREWPSIAIFERLRWDVNGVRGGGGVCRVLRRWVMSRARSWRGWG